MISRYDHYCRGDISKIENYDKAIADTKTVWHCHHRLETHDENGNRRQGKDLLSTDLIKMNKYYDVSPEELIYMLPDEHHKLHNEKQNERYTKEARMKMSEKAKSRHVVHTKEWNENISKSHKGRKLSEAHKEALRKNHVGMSGKKMPGFHWYNNGIENLRSRGECSEGFVPGKLKTSQQRELSF